MSFQRKYPFLSPLNLFLTSETKKECVCIFVSAGADSKGGTGAMTHTQRACVCLWVFVCLSICGIVALKRWINFDFFVWLSMFQCQFRVLNSKRPKRRQHKIFKGFFKFCKFVLWVGIFSSNISSWKKYLKKEKKLQKL